MHKFITALGVLALLGSAACYKNVPPVIREEPEPEPVTVTKEAIVGEYIVSKVERRTAGQRSDFTSTWFSSYAGDCAKDDITIFHLDNSFRVLDGIDACEESTDDTGTWALLSNTQLRIDRDTAKIEALTDTTLCIVSPGFSSQGELLITYTRK